MRKVVCGVIVRSCPDINRTPQCKTYIIKRRCIFEVHDAIPIQCQYLQGNQTSGQRSLTIHVALYQKQSTSV